MFGIGSTELLVILLVALIVLGPKSLAGVSRSLGKAMGEFRKVSNDFQRTLNVEAAQEEARERIKKREADVNAARKEEPRTDLNKEQKENCPQAPQDNNNINLAKKEEEATSPLQEAVAKAHAEATQTEITLNKNNG